MYGAAPPGVTRLSIHVGAVAIGIHRRRVAPRCTFKIMALPQSRTLGLSLGIIFVLFGVLEVIAHRNDTAGALRSGAFRCWVEVRSS